MNFARSLFIALFIISALYSALASSTLEIRKNGETCSPTIPHILIPWSAGCFYKKSVNSITDDQQQINFEKEMLDRFNKNNGVNTEILWHRLEFHIQHQHQFRVPFQDLHQMYSDYTKSEHIKLKRQVAYWHFLWKVDLLPLAQSTLDQYCGTYIINEKRRDLTAVELDWRLKQQQIPLKLEHCMSLFANANSTT